MKLTDRIRNATRALAAKDAPAKPATDAEIGVAGDFQAIYNREESRKDDVKIADYRKMRENDGTVNALYNLLTLPIKASKYDFEIPEGEAGGAAELELVTDNFTLPPHKGGMTVPFSLVIADMLRGVEDGFRAYEKVFTLNDKNKIVYRKIAPRDSDSVTLLRDDHGGFGGIRQRTWNGLDYIDVTIPTERAFLYTFGKEKNFLYGESAFKAAHYHYDRKHKLYYLQQLAAQAAAVPPRKLGVPESVMNNASKLSAAEAAADDFGVMQRITLPPGFTLDEYLTHPYDIQPGINHHDTLIARSTLMQFIVLAGSTTGSYGMSKDQSDLMLLALEGIANQLQYHINTYLIPDLINYNFGSGIYPEFKFAPMSSETKDLMKEAFTEILKRQDLPGYVVEGIAEDVANQLGIDIKAAKAEAEAAAKERAKNAPAPVAPVDPKAKPQLHDQQEGRSLSSSGYFRELTDAEQRVNLSDLTRRTQTAEERLTAEAETFYTGLKDDVVKRLTTLLNKGDYAALRTFKLGSFTSYRTKLADAMMEQYLYGKRTAADEIKGKIPQTSSKSRSYITQQAQAVADKQEADLAFIVKAEVTKELREANLSDTRDLGIADIMARLVGAFLAFTSNNVAAGIAVSLSGALNLGRGDSFGASTDIDRMQYSAILDNRTTQMCKDLDGSVVSYEEYEATKWIPPCHFGCRSIWVAILRDDGFKLDYRPIPVRPGGHLDPELSERFENPLRPH